MKIPTICRYCGGVIRLVPARRIYGASTDRLGLSNENIYLCQNCNARVGCHKGTNRPLGNVYMECEHFHLRQKCRSPEHNSPNYTHDMLMEDWGQGFCRFWTPQIQKGQHHEK